MISITPASTSARMKEGRGLRKGKKNEQHGRTREQSQATGGKEHKQNLATRERAGLSQFEQDRESQQELGEQGGQNDDTDPPSDVP